MKVLLLTTSFPLKKGSNSGIFIRKLVDNLPAGIKIIVLTPDNQSVSALESQPYRLVRFRYAPKKWQYLAHGSGGILAALSQKKISCLLIPFLLCSAFITCWWHAAKVDVVHANWSINGVVAGIAGILTGKPVVTTFRGSDVNLVQKSWLMRLFVGICLRLSRIVVTVSPSLKKALEEEFPHYRNEVRVIYNGIDEAFFLPRDNFKKRSAVVRFLCVGNLTAGKYVHVILQAVRSLKSDNWYLDVVGDGPEKKKLEEYCRRCNIEYRVIFHGKLPPEDVPKYMQQADVFVFASSAEGKPNVVLEAMAAGLPVVASMIPPVQELIENGKQGLLFPVGDVEKLSDILEHIHSHPEERKVMGEVARQYIVSQGLSWQETGRQYAAIYTEVLCDLAEGN